MAERLREDLFVDGVKRSLYKLVIQFHSQTNKTMKKDILNEFPKPKSKSILIYVIGSEKQGIENQMSVHNIRCNALYWKGYAHNKFIY